MGEQYGSEFNIGAIIKLDGEQELRSAVNSVKKSISGMKSELSLVKEEYHEQANSLEALRKKQDIYTKLLEEQKKKVTETEKCLKISSERYIKLKENVQKGNQAYEEAKNKLEEMKKSSDTSSDALKKQEKEVENLRIALKKGDANYLKQGNRVKSWEADLKKAEAEVAKVNNQLNENAKYLKEAQNSTDHCATSIDKFGKKTKIAVESTLDWKEALKGGIATKAVEAGIDVMKELGDDALGSTADMDKAAKQVQASTGLSEAAMRKYQSVMKEVYGNNYGDNFEDISESVSEITQSMGELNESDLKNVTENVLTLRDTFNMDFNETVRGADGLMKNMGVSAEEAFDLIGKGAQNGLNKSGELVENLAEYTQLWGQAGFSAEQMFSILQNGLDSGAYNLDKVNDFVKEFGASLIDGRIEASLSSFSGNTKELFYQWKDGRATTAQVFDSVVNDLASMTNQQEALTLASNTWSALGEDNAMQVITSLNQANNTYSNVKGTMESIKEIKYDDVNSQITELGRNIQMQFIDQLEKGLPVVKEGLEFVSDHLVETEILAGGLATALTFSKIKKSEKLASIIEMLGKMKITFGQTATAAIGTEAALEGTAVAAGGTAGAFGALKAAMLANPITVVAAAAGIAATAFIAYKAETKDATDATAKMLKQIDEEIEKRKSVDEAIQGNIRARKEEITDIEGEWSSIDMLAQRLIDLNNVKNKTPAQLAEMKAMVEELSSSIPELSNAFDEESGSIDMNETQLKELIATSKQYAIAKAAQSSLIEQGKDLFKAQKNLSEAEEELAKVEKQLNDARKENSGYQGIVTGGQNEIFEIQKRYNELKQEVEDYGKTYQKLSGEYDKTAESASEMIGSMDEVSDGTQAAAEATETATNDISNAYRTMQQAVQDALSDTGSIFEEYKQEDISTDTILKNMESQAKAFEDWQKNLKKLSKKAGKEMNEELFNQLANMGPEGAAYVKAFANMSDKELKKASKSFEKRTKAISDDTEKNSEKAAENWKDGMESMEDSADKSGKNMYSNLKDAFAKASNNIEKEGGSISSSTKKAFQKAVNNAEKAGVQIPKELADGISSGKVKPETAIKKINKAIADHGTDLIKEAEKMGIEVPNSISNGLSRGGDAAVQAIASLNSMIEKKQQETKQSSQKSGAEDSKAKASGIKSGSGQVSSAAKSVASAGVSGAKSQVGAFHSVGYNMSLGIASGIRSGESAAVNAARNVVKSAKKGANEEADSHSPSRVFRDQVGLMLSLGMAEGIKLGKKDAVSESVALCQAVIGGAQEELEIHSPSKKFKNAVGKQIAKGVAFGIKEGKGEAKKSAEQMSEETYTAATKWLENYKKKHKTSLADEKYYWQTVRKELKKGTDEYKKATDRIENTQMAQKIAKNFGVKLPKKKTSKNMKEYYGEVVSAAEQYLSNMKVTHNISLAQEEAYWAKVVKKVKKGSQAWYDAMKNLKEVRAEIKEQKKEAEEARKEAEQEKKEAQEEARKEKIDYGLSGDGLEAYKMYFQVSAQAEIEYWDIVRKQFKEGTAERIEADEKYFEAKENLTEQLKELEDDYDEKCKEVNENRKEEIDELNEAYKEAVKERKNEILSSTGIFEKFESTGYTKDRLLYNLKTQVAGVEIWKNDLAKLEGKGFSEAVLEQIKAMGPEAAASIHSLTEMSETEISEYNELWKQKEAMAEEQARKENEALEKETKAQIETIKRETQTLLDTYATEYKKGSSELKKSMEAPLKEMANKALTMGEETTYKYIGGLVQAAQKTAVTDKVSSAGKAVGNQIVNAAAEAMAESQKIEQTLIGIVEKASKNIGGNISSGIIVGMTTTVEGEMGSAAVGVSKSIIQSMKDALGIKSPSRVMRDQIGKMIPAGIGVGIKEGEEKAIKPAEDTIQEMMERVKKQTQVQNDKVAAYAAQIDTSGLRNLNDLLEIPEQQAPVVNVDNSSMTAIFQQLLLVMQEGFDSIKGLQVVTDTGVLAGELQPYISKESATQTIRRNRGRY